MRAIFKSSEALICEIYFCDKAPSLTYEIQLGQNWFGSHLIPGGDKARQITQSFQPLFWE